MSVEPVGRSGLILARDLREVGNEAAIRHALAAGEWHRVRRGAYLPSRQWSRLTQQERYRALVTATAMQLPEPPVLSHLSAASIWGLPIVGAPLDVVHATVRRSSGGRSTPGIRRHTVHRLPEIVGRGEVLVTTLERTVIDVARTESFLTAVVAADRALYVDPMTGRSLTTLGQLRRELDESARRPGFRSARAVLGFATTQVGWPGESLSRVRMRQLRYPPPVLQQRFVLPDGREVVPDFSWPEHRRVGEFDGLVKYQKPEYMSGRSASEVVIDEKRREDALRALGETVVRWTWDEAWDVQVFDRILRQAGLPRG